MPYISELRIFSFDYAPQGWALCNGQQLPIATNQILYSLIGNTYGGDGRVFFNLPNLQARVPMHVKAGMMKLGDSGGEATHALTVPEMPAHKHLVTASTKLPDTNNPANANWTAGTGFSPYGSRLVLPMAAQAMLPTGSTLPHENMSPFIVLNICIALVGMYPPRN